MTYSYINPVCAQDRSRGYCKAAAEAELIAVVKAAGATASACEAMAAAKEAEAALEQAIVWIGTVQAEQAAKAAMDAAELAVAAGREAARLAMASSKAADEAEAEALQAVGIEEQDTAAAADSEYVYFGQAVAAPCQVTVFFWPCVVYSVCWMDTNCHHLVIWGFRGTQG